MKETTTNRLVANLTLVASLCCGSALAENYRVPRLADGVPDLQGVWTNAYYQIVQSPGYVMIQVEMVHDARIIRIGDKHLPGPVRKWMGDSIGRWEGNTLVVETTHFRPEQSFRGSSEHMVVTERFTRWGRTRSIIASRSPTL